MRQLVAVVVSLLTCIAGASARTLTVHGPTVAVGVGDAFSVSLTVDGLGDGVAPSVGVFDVDLAFDAGQVMFVDANYGSGLDVLSLGSVRSTTEGVGTINLFELSLDSASDLNSLQPGNFSLATISFRALAAGTSYLNASINAIGDGAGVAIPFAVVNGEVAITAVPEVGSWLLLSIGLGGLLARRRWGVAGCLMARSGDRPAKGGPGPAKLKSRCVRPRQG